MGAHALAASRPPDEDQRRQPSARPSLAAVGGEGLVRLARVRVVLADDHDGIRLLLSTTLGLEPDFDVVGEASTGREALELAQAEGVDLLVLDLSMPELDGLEVLRRLSAQRPGLRVVVYTGVSRADVEEEARSLGARDYVVKGVTPDELIERLRAACR